MIKQNYKTGFKPSSSIFRKKLVWVILAVIVLGILLIVLEKTGVTNFITLKKKTPTATTGPTADQKKQEDAANAEVKNQAAVNEKGADAPTSSDTPAVTSISVKAQQETNNTVTVFTTLPGYSDGSCSLTITNNGKTTTQTAMVIYQQEAASCAGFSVPIDPLGKGLWNISLDVTSNGTTNNKSINYEVR